MHDWTEAFKTAFWLSPIIFIISVIVITDPMLFVTIIVLLLCIVFIIFVTAILVKLFWYIRDKYFE